MTYHINSKEARNYSRANLVIFDEVSALMRIVMNAADNGDYEVTVSDGTLMTESTPDISVTGTATSPVIAGGETLIVGGTTIVLGASGTTLNAIIADINDAAVSGLIASKANGKLVLTFTPSQQNWYITIGDGTANADLGITAGTYYAQNPLSVAYFQSWKGVTSSRKYDDEIARVLAYFENLGYNISLSENSTTQKTFKWNIYW